MGFLRVFSKDLWKIYKRFETDFFEKEFIGS